MTTVGKQHGAREPSGPCESPALEKNKNEPLIILAGFARRWVSSIIQPAGTKEQSDFQQLAAAHCTATPGTPGTGGLLGGGGSRAERVGRQRERVSFFIFFPLLLGCQEFFGGTEWVYLAPSRFHPHPTASPLHLSFPSPSPPPLFPTLSSPWLCAPLSPLLPLLSPGHSALVSTHNGCSVLTLLTLHSACAPGSGHGERGWLG